MNIIPLFEEYLSNTLIIVDVQEPFKKWWIKNGKDDLVHDIDEYCHSFSNVIQIWDNHDEDKPSYNFHNQKGAIMKRYSSKAGLPDYQDIFDGDELAAVDMMFKSGVFYNGLYRTKDGGYRLYVGGSHDWFAPSKELVDTLSSLNGGIMLVGGAEGECLYDIEVLLRVIGKKFEVNRTYTYNANDVGDGGVDKCGGC
jgi:hypothetical protein